MRVSLEQVAITLEFYASFTCVKIKTALSFGEIQVYFGGFSFSFFLFFFCELKYRRSYLFRGSPRDRLVIIISHHDQSTLMEKDGIHITFYGKLKQRIIFTISNQTLKGLTSTVPFNIEALLWSSLELVIPLYLSPYLKRQLNLHPPTLWYCLPTLGITSSSLWSTIWCICISMPSWLCFLILLCILGLTTFGSSVRSVFWSFLLGLAHFLLLLSFCQNFAWVLASAAFC